MSTETEKAPATLIADADEPTTSPATSSTLYCDVYGRVTATPPTAPEDLVSAVQPTDVLVIRPQRNLHWRDTLQHDGGLRWQMNGGRDDD
jgi:hypothetical protein